VRGFRLEKTYIVPFSEGLHARPASQFIQLVKDYSGEVQIEKEGTTVNGKSMLRIMMLGAKQGAQLTITLTGDETEATSIFSTLDAFFHA
jgi:phosphocarrier protein HPr